MTFRIDEVHPPCDGHVGWRFLVKGYQGGPGYVWLATEANGSGLFIYDEHAVMTGRHEGIAPMMRLPPTLKTDEVRRVLGRCLLNLGWGPWVGESGEEIILVQSTQSTAEPSTQPAVAADQEECICSRCGRVMPELDYEWQEMLYVHFQGGYGSEFGDGNWVEGHFCQHCVKELLGPYLRVSEEKSP